MRLTNPFAPRIVYERTAPESTFDINGLVRMWQLNATNWEETKAFRLVSDIFFAVTQRGDAVAGAPLRFFQPNTTGDKKYLEPAGNNVAAIFASPSSQMTGRDLIFGTSVCQDLFGIAFWRFVEGAREYGLREQIKLLNPASVQVKRTYDGLPLEYKVREGSQFATYGIDQIVEFPLFDPMFQGRPVSRIEPLAQAYNALYDAQRLLNQIFHSGGIPPGFFTTKGEPSDSTRKRIALQLSRMIRALRKSWETMVLPNDITYQRAGLTVSEMQFPEMYVTLLEAILREMRIPAFYAGITKGTGLNSDTAKAARKFLHEQVREPVCDVLAAAINERILSTGRFGLNLRCEFDFSKILAVQEQKIETAAQIVALTGAPILTRNEGRQWVGLLPIKGNPAADELLTTINMVTDDGRDAAAAADSTDAAAADSKDQKNPTKPRTALRTAHDPSRSAANVRDIRDRKRLLADRSLRVHERRMARGFRRVFRLQEERVIAKLRADLEPVRVVILDDLLADDAGDAAIIERITRAIVAEQGDAALSELGLDLAFDVTARDVRKWILDHAANAITDTAETTRARLRESLGEGVQANEGLDQLIARVREVFDGRRGNIATIARTETAPAYNFASLSAWDQSGVVEQKEWLTAEDDRVRDAHAAADGQVVRIDMPFTVEGESLDFPGDPAGSPDNVINCRCTLLPVVESSRVAIPKPIAERMKGLTNGNGVAHRTVAEWARVEAE